MEGGGYNDSFLVSSSPATAAEDPEFEGANVCRVAALSTMLGGKRQAARDVTPELDELGFRYGLASGERVWTDVDPLEAFASVGGDAAEGDGESRVRRWQMLNETARPREAIAFLAAILGSRLERESAAAAAALWRQLDGLDQRRWARRGPGWFRVWDRLYDLAGQDWPEPTWWGWEGSWPIPGQFGTDDPEATDEDSIPWDPAEWTRIYSRAASRLGDPYSNILIVGVLVRLRLGRALRSPDPITRSLAAAAFASAEPEPGNKEPPVASVATPTPPGALVVSTMIHGTWGWKGDWWRPRGHFHEFILRNHRPNLYSRGAKFSWSGAYRDAHRGIAAADFVAWAYDVAPNGLQTVFAHSYGGEVAVRAALDGARVNELVLLSVPVTSHVETAARSPLRVVDIRLRFDPVLALARRRQRMPDGPNLTTVLLTDWQLDHGATHEEPVWRREDIALRARL